jgi:ADP-ribose pyrophosphatase YjhB (NUDIX family)
VSKPQPGYSASSPAQRIALWADRIRAAAVSGQIYAPTPYDRDRYQLLFDLALEMLAYATGESSADLEPLRATVLSHVTPFAVGDAAIIDAMGRMLLIRRADNGLWAMPGGGLAPGETVAQGVVREALEETGVASEPVALAGVWDSRLCGTRSRHHLYQFIVLCRPLAVPVVNPPAYALEVLDTGWFAEEALPAAIDPGHVTRIPYAFRVWRGEAGAYFDL